MAEKARTAQSPPSINDLINLNCCDFYRNGNNLSSPQPSTSPATATGGGNSNSNSNITGQPSDGLSATPTTPIMAAPPPPPPPSTSATSMQSSDLGTPERLTHPLAIHGAFLSMHNSISPRDHSSADAKLKQSTPKSPSAASTAGKLGVAGSLLVPITTTSPSSSSSTPSHTGSTATATTPAGLLALKVRDGTLGKGRHGGGDDDDDDDDDATKGCDGPSVIVLKLRRDEKQRLRELVLQNEFVRNAAGLGERKLSGAFDAADDAYLRVFALLFLGHLARITRSVFDLGTQGFFEQKVLSPFVHCILVSVDESPADFPASLSASTTTVATPWSTSAAAATAAARASGLSSVPLSPVVAGAAAAAMMAHAGGAGGNGAAAGSAMLLGPPRRKLSNFSVNADDAAVFAGSSRRDSLRMRSNSIASPSYCSGTESCGIISSNISSIASSSITSPSTSSTSSTSSAALVTPATAVVAAAMATAKEKKVKKKKSVTAEAEDATQGGNRSGMYWSTPPTRRASPMQTAIPKSLEIPPLEQSVETTVEGLLVNKSAVVSLLLPRLCESLERALPPPAQLPAGVPSVLWKALELAARAVSRGCSDLLSAACDTRFLLCARRPKSASNPSSSSSSSSPSEPLLTTSSSSSSSSPLSSTIIATATSSTTTATAQKRPRKGVLKSTNSTGSINIPVASVSSQQQPQQQQQQQTTSSKHQSPILPQLLPSNPSLSSPFTQSGGGGGSGCSIPTTITITSPPSQSCPRSEETRSNSSSSSGSGSGGNSGGNGGSILPPVCVRTLHWGNVFRDKSTGMYVYRSKLDKVQIGALADTVKMCVERGADVPSAYILPARLFACGANWADFEFPVLFHLYVTRRVTRGELVRPTIIGSHAQIAQVRQALAESVPTPPRAQLQADGGDICAALAPEFEYFSEGRVKDLDEYIQFCEFDEATGAVRVALPIRSCPERRGYLVIRKRGALLFFYEDGRLTGIVDSDSQHAPNPRAAEFYAQHAIPPPPGTSPAAVAAASTSSSSSSTTTTASAPVPQLLLSSPPPVAPGFVFTPPDFGVTFLGTSNGFDKNGRTSGFILWLRGRGLAVDPPHGAHAYLAGCAGGGGSVLRMIDGIYLTHCHADHDSGLVQFLLAAQKRLPLYAADAVLCSERRKLAATLGCADPTVYYRPAPVPIGTPTKIGAGTFVFNYSFHSIPTVGFKVECCGKTLFYSADTKYDPALYADLEARGVLSPERARHLAAWGFDADHIIHEMGAPPLHTSVAVLTKLPPEVKARMCVIHCASAPEGIHKPLEGLENTLRFKVPKSDGDNDDPESDSRARSELEAEAARLLSTTVPFLASDPAAVEALAPLARKKTYSKGKKIAKTHSGLYIVAGGAVIRRPAEGGRVSPSPSPKLIDGNNANNSGGGSGNNSGKKKKKSSHHHQQQQHSQAQASPSPLSSGGSSCGSAVLYYGDYFGENTIANASASHSPYAHTAACTPTVVIRVSAKALRKILPQRRLLVPCLQGAGVPTTTTTTTTTPVPNLLRVFEAQCGEFTAEALLSPGERSLDRALAAVKGGGNNGNNGGGGNTSIPWAICIVRKGAVLVRAAGREAAFRKVGAGAWFAPGRVAGMCAVEETALCLVDSAAFEKVVTESPYLLYYVKNSGVLL